MADSGTHHSDVEGSEAFETTFADGEPPTVAVVRSVAAIEGVEPRDLDPLEYDVDTDALDRLFDHHDGEGAPLTVEFAYAGYRVSVRGDGRVSVGEPDA